MGREASPNFISPKMIGSDIRLVLLQHLVLPLLELLQHGRLVAEARHCEPGYPISERVLRRAIRCGVVLRLLCRLWL